MDHLTFKQIQKEYLNLLEQQKYEECKDKIKEAMAQFPEEEYFLLRDMIFVNSMLDNTEECKNIFQQALDRGFWYPAYQVFRKLFALESFKDIVTQWDSLRIEAEQKAKSEYMLSLPENFDPDKSYPLFIAFHGWGEDAQFFSEFWHSKKLREKFILLLPQSSQVIGSFSYAWNDRELALKEIHEIYEIIQKDYNIDTNHVILGGFSQGGTIAIDMLLNDSRIPAKSFIALNPDQPELFSDTTICHHSTLGSKGWIITGDKDSCLEEQQKMVEKLKELSFPIGFDIVPEHGHWFPEDLSDRLDNILSELLF